MTDEVWITIDDAERYSGLDRATCYRRVAESAESGWVSRVAIGEGGRSRTELLLSSLPMSAQCAYGMARLSAPNAPANDQVNLAEVCESARAEALRRLEIVRGVLEIKASREHVTERLAYFAAQVQESARTLARWSHALQAQGFAGLVPKWGEKKGTYTSIDPVVADLIRAEYLRDTQPTVTDVQRKVSRFCESVRLPAPCVATINRFIAREIPKPVQIAARLGPKAYRAHGEPKIRRDYSDLHVGEMWVGDHRRLDVFVAASRAKGAQIFRPWFTAWLDLRSRTCVGWHLDVTPSSHTIALALRSGILTYGSPSGLYTDRGKDYLADMWGATKKTKHHVDPNEATRTVRELLGIRFQQAQGETPWAKAIEPWFGHTFPVWEKTLPGWCGRDNKERPEKLAEEIQSGKLLTLDELRARLAERLHEYHATEHSALQATPASQWEGVEKRIPDPRALDIALMKHKPAKVYQDGIRLFGCRFYHDALFAVLGRTVEVRYDPANIGEIVCFLERKFLCVALADKAYTQRMSEREHQELLRRKKVARRQVRAALEAHPLVMDDERAVAQAVGDIQRQKVVVLPMAASGPEPSGAVLPMILGTERAGAAVAARRARAPFHEPEPPTDASGSADAMKYLLEG